MHRSLGLARGARGVVHDGVVVASSRLDGEIRRGLGHLGLVADVAGRERVAAASVLVDDQGVLQVGAFGQDVFDTLAKLRRGDQDRRPAVLEPVSHRVGAEGREQRPGDAPGLQDAQQHEVDLGQAVEKDEDAVALLGAEALEDVGELVRLDAHLLERVALLLATLAHPDHRLLVPSALLAVAVDALVGDIEPAAGKPGQLPLHLVPRERPARGVVVLQHRRKAQVSGALRDRVVVHGGTSIGMSTASATGWKSGLM